MFFLSCGALTRPFSLVFVKTLPKEERPSRKRKKEEYNKKRRERSGEIVKGRSSIYRKILGYYSTILWPLVLQEKQGVLEVDAVEKGYSDNTTSDA
jgi:hypothetical protein